MQEIMIISGGQTGVDRAALDTALKLNIPCGGWCPLGRKAEDGVLPGSYPLVETDSEDPKVRTERNVKESDGTLIIHTGQVDAGTAYTVSCCAISGKPLLEIDLSELYNIGNIVEWINNHQIRKLNIAGPRESFFPGIYDGTSRLMDQLLPALG
jgi:hypothetical protein